MKKNIFFTGVLGMMSLLSAVDQSIFTDLFPENVKTVAVIAPSTPPASLEKLDEAVNALKAAGYNVKEMPHVRDGAPAKGWESIDPAKRKADLEQAWLDPEVDLIFCVRGGTGAEDLVPLLDWEKLRQRPDMPLPGFSNVSALHMGMLAEKAGHPIAAPNLVFALGIDRKSIQSCQDVFAGRSPEPVQLTALRSGKASGTALAGHIYLLNVMSKTKYFPETKGKVIFLECPGYDAVFIKKLLWEMIHAGHFRDCSAVVFGDLKGAGNDALQLMKEFAQAVNCPVYYGFPYGHTAQNHAIDLRKNVTIDGNGVLYR